MLHTVSISNGEGETMIPKITTFIIFWSFFLIVGVFMFMDKIGDPTPFTLGWLLTSAGLSFIITQFVPHNLPGEKPDDF
jgi:hypothetical protein